MSLAITSKGRPADLLVLDAPLGSVGADWSAALRAGDVPAVCAAVTNGIVRFTRSRNTPAPRRPVTYSSAAPSLSATAH